MIVEKVGLRSASKKEQELPNYSSQIYVFAYLPQRGVIRREQCRRASIWRSSQILGGWWVGFDLVSNDRRSRRLSIGERIVQNGSSNHMRIAFSFSSKKGLGCRIPPRDTATYTDLSRGGIDKRVFAFSNLAAGSLKSEISRKGVDRIVEEHLNYNFRMQSFSIDRGSAELQRLKQKLASSVADSSRSTLMISVRMRITMRVIMTIGMKRTMSATMYTRVWRGDIFDIFAPRHFEVSRFCFSRFCIFEMFSSELQTAIPHVCWMQDILRAVFSVEL